MICKGPALENAVGAIALYNVLFALNCVIKLLYVCEQALKTLKDAHTADNLTHRYYHTVLKM